MRHEGAHRQVRHNSSARATTPTYPNRVGAAAVPSHASATHHLQQRRGRNRGRDEIGSKGILVISARKKH
uniref:Uncharacterized protein n=1 Tax=Oryza sativa subsp. japonica TaxID=39947 RepID=Q6YTT0_ORYSJ|nr:hypothetical protein [Oryza sativa Japonica Group]